MSSSTTTKYGNSTTTTSTTTTGPRTTTVRTSSRPQAPPPAPSTYYTPTEEIGDPQPAPGPETPRPYTSDAEPFPAATPYEQHEQQQHEHPDYPGHPGHLPDEFQHQQRHMNKPPQESFDGIEDEYPPKEHWGLPLYWENILFYIWAGPSWACEIAAAVLGSYYHTWSPEFIATVTVFEVLHWTAFIQTVVMMIQRCSWYRDSELQMEEHRQFFFLAVRLQRLMLPTAVIALPTFITAYARRHDQGDLAYWLLFLLFFIFSIVGCVMNAYNNITWEADLLNYEEGVYPIKGSKFALLGL